MPSEYMDWKSALADIIRNLPDYPAELLTGPLTVKVVAHVRKPKTSKLTHPRADCDNYVKGPLDAITQSERFWVDDKQVVDLVISKRWRPETEGEPGFDVTINPA